MNIEYIKDLIGKITPEMIVNYSEKAFDGYCYYKI